MNRQMKTIELQNSTGFEDYFFKIVVNGKEYDMDNHFLILQVPDDNSYVIKVENSLNPNNTSNSFEYTFNPKDNVVLQISRRQLTKTLISFIIGAIVVIMIAFFVQKGRFSFWIPIFIGACFGIYQMIRTKNLFIIREIPKS